MRSQNENFNANLTNLKIHGAAPAPLPVISARPPSTTLLGLATSSRRPAVPGLLHRLPAPATPSVAPIAFSARPVAVPERPSVQVPSHRLTIPAPSRSQPATPSSKSATPLNSENGTSVREYGVGKFEAGGCLLLHKEWDERRGLEAKELRD
ncbi:hypothetical protein PIB30_028422 [Stylosanthes scabra]|uniref:Uncharacterized protein n=1 Tax=Stylosanthes scabra TaxID=79078 RepID=A0ABU6WAP1_9FABA|nr:hypothetical protein [Stylosanthes scabra]